MGITSEIIFNATGYMLYDVNYDGLGLLAEDSRDNLLSFIEEIKYIPLLNSFTNISAVFCSKLVSDSGLVSEHIRLIVVDDPKWMFFSIVDYLGKNKVRSISVIDSSSKIHSSSYISPLGVKIGKNCIIEPNVTILSDVDIGDNVIIHSGAVVGCDGFEHKKTTKGILSVVHDGHLYIQSDVEIGANSHIAKGFSYRSTIIGKNTKIDALVHYAHGVQCGSECMVAANAMIAGNVTIGDNVWIGPSSCISNRVEIKNNAYISLGSVVVKNVLEKQKVTGNFAVSHMQFLRDLKRKYHD